MSILAITAAKGGVGKTTTAAGLAGVLGDAGQRVLCVDLDPQGSLTAWLGQKSIDILGAAVLDGEPLGTLPTDWPGVELVPADPGLTEQAMSGQPGAVLGLRAALASLSGSWDWIILDCPPAMGLLPVAACLAAEQVLIPVEPSSAGLAAIGPTLEAVAGVAKRLPPGPNVAGLVLVRADPRTVLAREAQEVLARPGLPPVLATIPQTIRVPEAMTWRTPIAERDPEGPAAAAFRELAQRIQEAT